MLLHVGTRLTDFTACEGTRGRLKAGIIHLPEDARQQWAAFGKGPLVLLSDGIRHWGQLMAKCVREHRRSLFTAAFHLMICDFKIEIKQKTLFDVLPIAKSDTHARPRCQN